MNGTYAIQAKERKKNMLSRVTLIRAERTNRLVSVYSEAEIANTLTLAPEYIKPNEESWLGT